ncbi:MAG: hypothetical protein ACREJU_10775 [Nitrospiraceae bacterium]
MNVFRHDERGAALLGAVLVTVILSMLGTVSLNLGIHEVAQVRGAADEAVAQHLTEAGSDLVVQWFHDPSSAPEGTVSKLLEKRFHLPENGPSFFDAMGQSQFRGTSISPDVIFDASHPADDLILNDAGRGMFRSLRSLGRVLKLKVYGPSRPGLLCTVEITAGAKDLTRTLAVQLGSWSIPPLRAGVQIGKTEVTMASDTPFPVGVHWGDLKIQGDARFGKKEEFPLKSQLASVTGQSYADAPVREDRWLDIFVGGEALFSPSSASSLLTPPHLYTHQDPNPGLHQDRWDYETMKKYAILFGSYYAQDRDGMLYRNGVIQPELGLTPDEVFASRSVGDHHGLVFIDTLDQLPPRSDNLGNLSVTTEYAEGVFIVNAHLHLRTTGAGKSVPALSPPPEGSTTLGTRIPVELSGMHVQGVLYTAGDLTFEGHPRVYGAVVTEGKVAPLSSDLMSIEVWYNYDLRSGLFRGVPLVRVAPGTWQQKY